MAGPAVVGTSDLALRLFSVLWALAAFPLLWSLGHRLGGHAAAASAATLYALAPASLFYSVEGRMYSMLWFLALAFVWLLCELHLKGTRPWRLFPLGHHRGGWFFHPLLLRLCMGCRCALAGAAPR